MTYPGTPPAAAPAPGLRQALEEALSADPDDQAAHAAYADFLAEQGDPRGEFIQVQLALEGVELPSERYRELRRREAELLRLHEPDWLGPEISRLFARHRQRPWQERRARPLLRFRWHRGWLQVLEVAELGGELAREMHALPAARFLQRLVVEREAAPDHEMSPLECLLDAPWLDSLRLFQFGPVPTGWLSVDPPEGGRFVRAPTSLRHLLARAVRLRELRLYVRGIDPGWWGEWPLSRLADLEVLNTRLFRLAPLVNRPPLPRLDRFAVLAVVDSPGVLAHIDRDDLRQFLARAALPALQELHLPGTDIDNAGANLLVQSPLARQLKCLDLRPSRLSSSVIAALRACGIADLRV